MYLYKKNKYIYMYVYKYMYTYLVHIIESFLQREYILFTLKYIYICIYISIAHQSIC